MREADKMGARHYLATAGDTPLRGFFIRVVMQGRKVARTRCLTLFNFSSSYQAAIHIPA